MCFENRPGRCNTLCYSGGVISDTGAFAAILSDGSVVTWGSAECGGDSSSVQHQLKDVQDIAATSSAFAARLKDGSVVSWGQGGVWQEQDPLRRVRHIEGSDDAFAAILDDDSVVTWGSGHGAHSCHVESQLRGVQEISATCGAFAAIRQDGLVVTWGDAECGGDSRAVQAQLMYRLLQPLRAKGNIVNTQKKAHLPPSSVMGLWSLGVVQSAAVTAAQSSIS